MKCESTNIRKFVWIRKLALIQCLTLIELLVTISIISIVTVLTLADYPSFSEKILLDRATREVVLTLRKAQAFAIGVKEAEINDFPWYGVHFDSASIDDKNKTYILFADSDSEDPLSFGYRSYSQGDIDIEKNQLPGSVRIIDLCTHSAGIPEPFDFECGSSKIDIVFSRPDPSTTINSDENIQAAKIILETEDYEKSVIIRDNGKIYVE